MRFRYDSMRGRCLHFARSIVERSVRAKQGRDAIIRAMLSRRFLLIASAALGAATCGRGLQAQQRRSLADPLRLGVDTALFDGGLARALQQGFGRDTGIAVLLVRSPATSLLEALDRGEVDAALCNTPDAEARLDQLGLVHDRKMVARGEFVIVGPSSPGPAHGAAPGAARGPAGDPAHIAGMRDAAMALQRLRDAALADPATPYFLSAADGSGVHVAEQALWRAARIAPAAPWYAAAAPGSGLLAQARARPAYALVERGAWIAQGGSPLAVLVEGDPALAEAVHVMRSFRVSHPAGKIFVSWITGPKGRSVVAKSRGYRPPSP